MKHAIATTLLTTFLIGIAGSILVAKEGERPPSIVIFLADDVSWNDFGCYGHPNIRTPEIDALASDGLLCENAFLTTSSCSPTRISVLTGKYPHSTGAEDLHMPLPPDQRFVSSYLKEAGYTTGHMLKTHYGENGNNQFDWYGSSVNEFDSFLDLADDTPFFLWVGFRDAHRPYSQGSIDQPHSEEDAVVPPFLADTPETRADLALYYDEIARMDSQIGAMVRELKNRDRFDDTLIVFFADNGAPFPRAKGSLYDSGIKTPLIFCWPSQIRSGTTFSGLTSVIDLAPTLLDIAGSPSPGDFQGQSLLPILQDPSRPGRLNVFSQRNWHNCDHHMRSVRTKRFKLIRNAYLDEPFGNPSDVSSSPSWNALLALREAGELTATQSQLFEYPRPQFELYDLEADPWESQNLAGQSEYQEVLSQLEGALDQWSQSTGDYPSRYRRRGDNTNRITGVKFTREIPTQTDPLPEGFRP